MITKLIGAATLFSAGGLMAGGPPSIGATPVQPFSPEASLLQAGSCGSQEPKEEGKAPAKAKEDKAKDGSCGKGSCGSKDVKKGPKDASCGSKAAKKDKKEGSCGKDKKDAPGEAEKK
jgi:hypothetical protein